MNESLYNLMRQIYGLLDDYFENEKQTEKPLTLGEWLDTWFKSFKLKQNKSRSSNATLKYIDNTLRPALGDIPLTDLKFMQLQEFINGIQKGNTRKKLAMILNASLDKAVRAEKIAKNPFDGVTVATYQKTHYKPLEFIQQSAVLRSITLPQHKAAFMVLCCIGTRIGEFLALDFAKDVDYENRQITVNKAIDIKTGKLNDFTKTESGMRKIPFSKLLVPHLETLKKFQQQGGKFSYDMLNQYIKRRYLWCDCKGCNLHSLRHTFISVCYYAGIRDKMIQRLAGHSTVELTMNVYTHILEKGTSPILTIIKDLASEQVYTDK